MGVDRAAADQALVELELAQRLQQLAGGGDDLRADPVAGQDDYAGRRSRGADSKGRPAPALGGDASMLRRT